MAIFSLISRKFLTLTLLVDVRKIRTTLRWNYESAGFQLQTLQIHVRIFLSYTFLFDNNFSKQITWIQEKFTLHSPLIFTENLRSSVRFVMPTSWSDVTFLQSQSESRDCHFWRQHLAAESKLAPPHTSTVLALGGPLRGRPGPGYKQDISDAGGRCQNFRIFRGRDLYMLFVHVPLSRRRRNLTHRIRSFSAFTFSSMLFENGQSCIDFSGFDFSSSVISILCEHSWHMIMSDVNLELDIRCKLIYYWKWLITAFICRIRFSVDILLGDHMSPHHNFCSSPPDLPIAAGCH